jgi:high-affinity iron transporter
MRRCLTFLLFVLASLQPLYAATDGPGTIDTILERGEAAVRNYDPLHPLPAAGEFSALYFEVFEASGMELDLGIKDPALKTELEVLFGALNGNAMRGVPKERLEASWRELAGQLEKARVLYAQEESSVLSTFLKALLILLREGAEAMLVVGALAAYLRRAGAADRVWVIHAGVAVAVPLSLLTGWALGSVLQASGAPLAVIEGITMLAAAAVLFYVSCWLLAKREAARWQSWVTGQMERALGSGSLLALGGASCLAVYREGAETVLFYQALAATAPGQGSAIAAGLATALLLLCVLYLAMRQATLRLPFRLFFGGTAILLHLLAVVFVGQAIVELQAAGWIASIHLPGFPNVGWLGIAPTLQGLLAQTALLLLALPWWWQQRTRKEALHAG